MTTGKTPLEKGFTIALIDMLIYGLYPVFSHILALQIDPIVFAGVITCIGAIPLLIYIIYKGQLNQLFGLKYLKELLLIAILTLTGTLLFFEGTTLTSGINTGLLLQIEPFYAIVISALILKEKITGKQLLAVTLMVLGALVIVFKGFDKINSGDLMILATPIFFQFSHLATKQALAKGAGFHIIPAARMFYGGLIMLVLALIFRPAAFAAISGSNTLLALVLFGLIFKTLDLVLWYKALSLISVLKASALLPVTAAVSFMGSLYILQEPISWQQVAGLILLLVGLLFMSQQYLSTDEHEAPEKI